MYLEGSHAELDAEAQVNAEVVRQKIEEHVVSAKQRDEEEGGFGQASVAHNKETRFRSWSYLKELFIVSLIWMLLWMASCIQSR